MSILDLYNNPPKGGRQIRFANGQVPAAGADYQAYQRNDQASLRNSKLHADSSSPGNEVAGYSSAGSPKVSLYSDEYFAVGERPTDLSMYGGRTISTETFQQPYTPDNGYAYTAHNADLLSLGDIKGASDALQALER